MLQPAIFDHQSDPEIDGRGERNQKEEAGVPPSIENIAHDQKHVVLEAKRQPQIHAVDQNKKDYEFLWSRDTSAKPYPLLTARNHHWPNSLMAASCCVISASIRQILQPPSRNRTQSSGSSPAISCGRNPPAASKASTRISASPPQ